MNDRGHLSSETLDLLMLSSLAQAESESARAHLSGCTDCKARWTEIEEDKARFQQFVLPRTLAAVEARARTVPLAERLFGSWKLWVPVASLAAAATLVAVVSTQSGPSTDPYLGVKGGTAQLEVVAQRGDQTQFSVRQGSRLRPKDKLRFVVDPGGAHFVLIASRDGRGGVTIYYPFEGKESAEVKPGRQALPVSIELDEVSGPERLLAVFSEKPVPADQVRSALAGPEVTTVPGSKSQVSWEFVKEAP